MELEGHFLAKKPNSPRHRGIDLALSLCFTSTYT